MLRASSFRLASSSGASVGPRMVITGLPRGGESMARSTNVCSPSLLTIMRAVGRRVRHQVLPCGPNVAGKYEFVPQVDQ